MHSQYYLPSDFLSLGDLESYFQLFHIKTWECWKYWNSQWITYIYECIYLCLAPSHSLKDFRQCWEANDVFCCWDFCAVNSRKNNPEWQVVQIKVFWMENPETRILIPALPLVDCVTLGKPLNLSGHQFPAVKTVLLVWFSYLSLSSSSWN